MKSEQFKSTYPNTFKYVSQNNTRCRRCNKCGKVVLKETNVSNYPYQCMSCDENLYEIETHIGACCTDLEFDELCENALILELDVEVKNNIHVNTEPSFIPATLEQSYDWVIGICNFATDGVTIYRFYGTKSDVKQKLLSLVLEDKENDEENWKYGTESTEDVRDEYNGLGYEWYAYGNYYNYHIVYTAKEWSHIVLHKEE